MEDWKVFYTRAINYLEALNIDAEKADNQKSGWKQLKMMFEGEGWKTLQSLINNGTITPESQRMLQKLLDTISTMIKDEECYWHFWDELLSDVHQLPNEGIHALNAHITTLIYQCKFPHSKTQEMLKLMILQHAA